MAFQLRPDPEREQDADGYSIQQIDVRVAGTTIQVYEVGWHDWFINWTMTREQAEQLVAEQKAAAARHAMTGE